MKPVLVLLLAAAIARGDEPKKPEPKLPLGKDTTIVSGPLDKDGFIDYIAALNERLGKGITPEKNANVALLKVLGPKPEGAPMPPQYYKLLGVAEPPDEGKYFFGIMTYTKNQKLDETESRAVYDQQSRATSRPWTENDLPHIAAWLKSNEESLALTREVVARPEYFNPLVTGRNTKGPGSIIAALLPIAQKSRELSAALTARAMLYTTDGKYDEAWQDLLTCHRLGRLVARGGTMIEALVGFAVDQNASAAGVAHFASGKLTAEQLRRRIKDLETLPPLPSIADKVDLAERFSYLDTLQMMLRGDAKGDAADALKALQSLDWAPVLRDANKWYDRLAAAMRLPTRAERQKEFAKIDQDLKALRKELPTGLDDRLDLSKTPAKSMGTVLLGLLMPALDKVQTAHDRVTQHALNLRLAGALAAYHADHGHYPAKLDELSPTYFAKVPDDLFSGKALLYKPTADGYLLHSVGPNGNDDGGRSSEDDPKGDDLRVKMPLPEKK